MNAIIVPGVTDLNKGDQALVWESWRLAKDTGLYNEVYILDAGDNDEERELLCKQSEEHGFKLLENILKHPRRGQHKSGEHIKESKMELLKQIKNAAMDFKDTRYLIKICNDLEKVRKNFDDKTYRTVKQFHEAKTIFVKGGGFIHAYGEKTAPYLMWYFLFYVRLAKALGKKVVFLPNSYGPFIGLTVEKQVRSVFGKLDLVYARENVSAQSLGQLMGKKIPVEMDLGFFLEKGSQEEAVKILEKYNLSKEDKIVGVTIRPWRFPGLSNPEALYKKYIDSVADLTRHLLAKGYKVALCNQSLGPNSHEDDRNAIKDLLAQVNDPNIIWINENLSCDILKAVYSNFYFFIGTRFHSIIFSLTSLVPSIAIGYGGNKAKGIMGDFRLDDYVVQIQDVESDLLINMFDKAISEYDNIKTQLNKSMGLVTESRNRLIQDIKSLY
ncbi:polysaccharide pyruvyl transferase family protein [Chryseobacterium profundimaris]|uniref:Colanic acid/amylovoran biosynthesis protein n=1 Tax=Chryseobacterium profundimaris TaxID=1387275 RepID=A0ABY1NTD4_9FLAO|nr:polysaccharide pyruvyl transferase family protein [Chryseobacterium profundimaris]SMP15498.1 colanic acid/amylovoran biosynthesis protein [Chryseobacterium profundimaris]